VSCYLLF